MRELTVVAVGHQVVTVDPERGLVGGAAIKAETGTTCSCPVPTRVPDLLGVRCAKCDHFLPADRAEPPVGGVHPQAGTILHRWKKNTLRKYVVQENGALRMIWPKLWNDPGET